MLALIFFPNHFCLGLLKLQILPAGAPNPSSIAGAEIGGSGADLAQRGRDSIIIIPRGVGGVASGYNSSRCVSLQFLKGRPRLQMRAFVPSGTTTILRVHVLDSAELWPTSRPGIRVRSDLRIERWNASKVRAFFPRNALQSSRVAAALLRRGGSA